MSVQSGVPKLTTPNFEVDCPHLNRIDVQAVDFFISNAVFRATDTLQLLLSDTEELLAQAAAVALKLTGNNSQNAASLDELLDSIAELGAAVSSFALCMS